MYLYPSLLLNVLADNAKSEPEVPDTVPGHGVPAPKSLAPIPFDSSPNPAAVASGQPPHTAPHNNSCGSSLMIH